MLSEVAPVVSPQIEVSERFALVPVSVIASLTAKVSHSAVIVYVALASFADRGGVCWPSRKTLAAMTHLSINHISKVTSDLQDAGFLVKETGKNGLTIYRLTVVPLRKAPDKHEATPPTQVNKPPLRKCVDRTAQGTEHKTREAERLYQDEPAIEAKAAEAFTAEAKAADVVSLSEIQQRPKTPKGSLTALPDTWTLPDDFRKRAERMRPDLTDRLDTVAENFSDYHRSKGTRSACWVAEWDRWIRREYSPGRLPVVRRYPAPGREKEPPTALEQAAIDASNRRFQEQCREMGLAVAGSPGRLKASPTEVRQVSPLKESLKVLGVRLRS